MTIESTINCNRYVGNGTTKSFPFSFKVWEPDEVAVWIGDGTSERNAVSSCKVAVSKSGGTVTFAEAPAEGTLIAITRAMPYTQLDDYLNATRFNAEEVEDRFDMDCAERQDLKLDLSRCLKIPHTSTLNADDLLQAILLAIEELKKGGDISGETLIRALGTTAYRMLAAHLGDWVVLKNFGAVGDGSTDDTPAWNAWQAKLASGGMGYIPAGDYLVNGTVLHFNSGCIGNGRYSDAGYWTQSQLGGNSRHNIIRHSGSYTYTPTAARLVDDEPVIKVQTVVTHDNPDPDQAFNFTRVLGGHFEAIGSGDYKWKTDGSTGNFTVLAATAHNKFSGRMGMTAITGRVWDADETDAPHIDETHGSDGTGYGASKSCGGYFPFIRKAKHARGGYMIGLETYCMNRAAETGVAYENNDTFVFGTGGSWTCGYHCTGYGGSHSENVNGAPISAAIMIDGAGDAHHAFWNGIVIGSSAMKIDDDTEGHAGTVGISFASWRPTRTSNGVTTVGRFGDQAIRFGHANHHLHFRSGARIWSPDTVFGYEGTAEDDQEATDTSGILIMAPSNGIPYLNLGTGTFNGTRTNKFGIRVNSTDGNVIHNLRSGSSHVFAFTSDSTTTYVYNLNTGFFTCSGTQTLGTGQSLWGQIYSTNSTISTSDERLKQDIEALPDALLDAWDGIDWRQFRFKDAVAEKGEAARTHTGLVAQRVKAVLDAAGVDSTRYGFLCFDEYEASYETVQVVDEPAHINENDELVPDKVHEESRLVKPAGDAWSLRYEEALCIEAAYVRREIARIKAQIGMS